jgi:hypothetical protein
MIVFRRKEFALADDQGQGQIVSSPQQSDQASITNEVTSRTLLLQQMRLQRQIIQTQQARRKLEQQERLSKMKQLGQLQKTEQEKEDREKSNQVQIKKSEDGVRKMNDNTNLYKSKAKTVPPVSMKV